MLPTAHKMARRQKPAWSQLTWGQVLSMEVIFGLSLLAVLCGVAVIEYESAVAKARLSEVFSFLGVERLALQEQWALTGEGSPSLQAGTTRPADTTSGRGEGSRRLKYSVTQVESSLIVKGTLDEKPFFLSYTPAVIASGVPGSMMWLCGNRKPPTGWVRLPGPTGTDLPAKYLFSVCRDNK